MSININAEIRKFVKQAYGSAEKTLRMTQYESQAVALTEPENWEVGRSGRRFFGGAQNGATGRAPVQAVPTTAAAWVLFNGEQATGASYCIEAITVFQLSGTAAVGGVILAGLTPTIIAAPTAAGSYSTASASRGSRTSKAVWADNQTLSVTPTWMAIAGNGNPATTTNGGMTADGIKGRLIVQPGYALAIHYLSGTGTTPLFLASCIWCEMDGAEIE